MSPAANKLLNLVSSLTGLSNLNEHELRVGLICDEQMVDLENQG